MSPRVPHCDLLHIYFASSSERENSDDGKDADDGDEVDERGKNDRGPESANNAMLRCPHCGRLFRTERIAKHVHKCSKEAEEIGGSSAEIPQRRGQG